MSPTPDSTLDPQQVIADLKRQLAERTAERDEYKTERDEALEQQTATAEVLQVINSSPGDLAPVFDALLEKATRLCEAPFGTLWTFDGDRFDVCAVHGEPRFRDWVRHRDPIRPDRDASPLGRILAGERVVSFADWRDEGYRVSSRTREMTEASGIRSAIWVALHKDDVLLGTITVYRQEVRPFSDKQIALLQNFAAQAVIAMENARLLGELRQRTGDLEQSLEYQTATSDVLKVIARSTFELGPVLQTVIETAVRICAADKGGFNLLRSDGLYRMLASTGYTNEYHDLLARTPVTPGRGTLTGRTALEADVVHIMDVQTDSEYTWSDSASLGDFRSALGVPLLREGSPIGVLCLLRTHMEPFTDKQIELVTTFADQAVIAMENTRLLTETREALEQQTATAEVLQVINSSPGDLAPVFDAMLEKALHLCEASYGGLQTFDGEFFRMVAHRGDQRYQDLAMQMGLFRPEPGSTVDRLVQGESVVQVLDLSADEQYKGDGPIRRTLVEIGGARTFLSIALRKDEVLVGALHVYRQEVRPFTDKQIALLQNFAAQAVIAMENARLLSELRKRTDEVAELNRGLEARVAEQVDELGRVGRLKRFLAPQLAELIVSQGDEKILESHRREIVVVFCDLRGYTAFTETAEPEEVLEFLRQYHGALGPLVSQFEGTLDQFSGDGIMVFFNDPVPCPDPAERAVNMAVAMRDSSSELIAAWSRHGCELGFGVGIAQGFATLGQIGFSERSGYTAIGTVCNLAARLCAEAKDGQILVSSRIAEAVEAVARLEDLGNLDLKGLRRPVAAFNVAQSTSPAEARPNLTVVARDTGA